jgi:hypothetical protein
VEQETERFAIIINGESRCSCGVIYGTVIGDKVQGEGDVWGQMMMCDGV